MGRESSGWGDLLYTCNCVSPTEPGCLSSTSSSSPRSLDHWCWLVISSPGVLHCHSWNYINVLIMYINTIFKVNHVERFTSVQYITYYISFYLNVQCVRHKPRYYPDLALTGCWGNQNLVANVSTAVPHLVSGGLWGARGGNFPSLSIILAGFFVPVIFSIK